MDIAGYTQKYQRIMKQLEKLVEELKQEDYNSRLSFVLSALDDDCIAGKDQHPLLFNEIILPVFIEEYKNENAKFIYFIGKYFKMIKPAKTEFLEEINLSNELYHADDHSCLVYFYGKSFMLDKNQMTLDYLFEILSRHFIISFWCDDESDLVKFPTRYYMEFVKPLEEKLKKCKELCKISGNDKWGKVLAEWEGMVAVLYKYGDYVREHAYMSFNDYLKEIGLMKKIEGKPNHYSCSITP